MKRLISILLVVTLCLGTVTMAASAAKNPFKDVSSSQWYYNDVINAYEMGLINGKTANTYKPDDKLTYAEAVKLAACMHQRYTRGSVTLKNGDPWYQTYVDYCKDEGIISKNYVWNSYASRANYIEIFSKALPSNALSAINNISDGAIPDVPMTHEQAASIYKMYRAGIVQGNGADRYCNPSASIKRSEVAAILTRMMDAQQRQVFSMSTGKLSITQQPVSVEASAGRTVSFSVLASGGTAPYTYKWEASASGYSWTSVSRGNKNVLSVTLSDADLRDGLQFRCIVTDAAGKSVTSSVAKVNAPRTNLKIVAQPTSTIADEGDAVVMSVTVTGGKAPYGFVWIDAIGENLYNYGGADVTNYDDTSVLKFRASAHNWTGNSSIRCLITDADGKSVTTNSVYVHVNEETYKIRSVDAYMVDKNVVNVGDTCAIYAEVHGGSGSFIYKWYCNGRRLYDNSTFSGTSSNILYYTPGSNDVGYPSFYCVVADSKGYNNTKESNSVVVEVTNSGQSPDGPFYIYSEPVGGAVNPGDTFEIYFSTTGDMDTHTYQWLYRVPGGRWMTTDNNSMFEVNKASLYFTPFDAYTDTTIEFMCRVSDFVGQYTVETEIASVYVR